jgi:diaminohydroxyphosphoribosylaminopyrimidine deaminase / 5-amino-6-(5-phosphoribosylamino)uracil reductase
LNADRRWMDCALRLGQRALGTTAENPPVGCVIVKDDKLLGVGWTQPGGRPHAETEALRMAGNSARGATAYVTLEPCAHHGRTGPCADALIAAGVARVVTAMEDPDPRTCGAGHTKLKASGISVQTGVRAAAARATFAGFLTRITKKRPYVILKMGVSADGKIAAAPGQRTTITGLETKSRVHLLRAQCDAVLVGAGTMRADQPELTCRLPGLENRSPRRIIVESKNGNRLNISELVLQLGREGINRLLVEGGAQIARSFVDADLIDEIQLFQSPMTIGPQGVDAIADMPLSQLDIRFKHSAEEKLGSDTLTVYERR